MKSINTKFKVNNEFIQTEQAIPENKVDFYAPENAGNSGQILQSNGAGSLPRWIDKIDDNDKLDKVTTTADYDRAYIVKANGTQDVMNISDDMPTPSSLVKRNSNGGVITRLWSETGIPLADNEVVPVNYLEDKLSKISVETDNQTISKTSDDKLQAIGLTDGENIDTFEEINAALTIERL